MKYYKQTETVDWLPTTEKGDLWIETEHPYVQPNDVSKRTSVLGVNLQLIDDEHFVFEEIKTIVASVNETIE